MKTHRCCVQQKGDDDMTLFKSKLSLFLFAKKQCLYVSNLPNTLISCNVLSFECLFSPVIGCDLDLE